MTESTAKRPTPPFVEIAGTLYVAVNWDPATRDTPHAPLLRPLTPAEERVYRGLVAMAEFEAFQRIQRVTR